MYIFIFGFLFGGLVGIIVLLIILINKENFMKELTHKNDNHGKIISNKELDKLLSSEGVQMVKIMYINRMIHLTQRERDYVNNYKEGGEKVEKSRIQHKQK